MLTSVYYAHKNKNTNNDKRVIGIAQLCLAVVLKFPNCLCGISTRQLELLLWRTGLTAQHIQDCPIFFIQLNYVHNNKEIRCCHLMINSPATR